jgi:hypothetical protein
MVDLADLLVRGEDRDFRTVWPVLLLRAVRARVGLADTRALLLRLTAGSLFRFRSAIMRCRGLVLVIARIFIVQAETREQDSGEQIGCCPTPKRGVVPALPIVSMVIRIFSG